MKIHIRHNGDVFPASRITGTDNTKLNPEKYLLVAFDVFVAFVVFVVFDAFVVLRQDYPLTE